MTSINHINSEDSQAVRRQILWEFGLSEAEIDSIMSRTEEDFMEDLENYHDILEDCCYRDICYCLFDCLAFAELEYNEVEAIEVYEPTQEDWQYLAELEV